jgi:hypothetical protein
MIRASLFVIGGIVFANIVWATFFWHAPAQDKPVPVANAATERGQDPWMARDHISEGVRKSARRSMLAALGKPFAEHCTPEGRKLLLDAINYYYSQRDIQLKSYAKNWGEPAARYAAKAWATPDDNRIERLTRETFGRGTFTLDELRPYVRPAVADLVKGERVSGKLCTG